MSDTKPTESRISLAVRTFCALPMFLILTVIFWEFVFGAWLLSRWLYEKEWPVLGLAAKVLMVVLALVTIYMTVVVFVGWIVQLVRVIRGRET
jgi:hypothetical protein